LAHFQRATRRYIQEDRTLHNHRCENLKSHMNINFVTCFIVRILLCIMYSIIIQPSTQQIRNNEQSTNRTTEREQPLPNNKRTWHPYTGHDTTYTITLPSSLKRKIEHNFAYTRKTAM
jgi:hypothetical protein